MPSNYLHKFNTDNVHARAVIVGLVNMLNSKVQFENVYSDTDIQEVIVPFYYNFGGDERFLQDYFLEWNECVTPKMVDGNIDPIPRGIVTLTSSTVNSNQLANRFVRANYVKQVGNEVLTYNSFLNSIPLTMNFDVEIVCDTSLDAFKIQQAVLETFFKTQVFSVEFRGFRVPCQVGFPEDQGIEKTFEFTYQTETTIKFNCPLQLDTYFPVTDKTTERFSGNRMNYPGGPNIEFTTDEKYSLPRLHFISPEADETYFSSGETVIRWENTGPITRVNIYYRIVGGLDWVPIVKNYQNSGQYTWTLPYLNAAGVKIADEPTKVFVNSPSGSGAKLRAIIDSLGSVDQIIIMNPGNAYNGTDNIIVSNLGVGTTLPPNISPSVIGGFINGTEIFAVGSGFTPTPINQLELKIENSNDENVFTMLRKTIKFQGQTTLGSDIITNIAPSISNPTTLAELGLYPGQPLDGAGIPIGTTIVAINTPTPNTIKISNPSNLSSPLSLITGDDIISSITLE